jgi:Fic family protein
MSGPGGFQPSFRITHRMTAGLTRTERARGFLEAARLSADWLEMMRSRAFVLEAHHTTHIEGTRLTLEQAERLLAGEAIVGTDPEDVRELLNYRDAFEFVSGYLNDGPVTEGLIREIHRRLVAGVRGGSAAPGEYRRVQNYVVNAATGQTIYTSPLPYNVPPLMAELVAWLNMVSDIHPVLVSGVAQFQLVHIHPFVDQWPDLTAVVNTLPVSGWL